MSHAARMLGIARSTLYARVGVEPKLREFREELREELIDCIESELIKAALAGEPWAVKYYLTTQARHRGYGSGGSVPEVAMGVGTDFEAREARIASSKIDLRTLSAEQLECLAEIAEQAQQRALGDEGR